MSNTANSLPRSKADLHLHTTYSDGFLSPQETVDMIAARTDLRVVAITDHNTAAGAFVARDHARRHYPNLDVIIGQEVTTGDGDVLGLFLRHTIAYCRSAVDAIEAIHAQGGLAVAAHPFVRHFGLASVGYLIRTLPFDAVEVRHGVPFSLLHNWRAGLVNARAQKLPALGNSDSHVPFTAGEAFTWFPGHSVDDLRRAIETNTVEPGGSLWSLGNILRKLPLLLHNFVDSARQNGREPLDGEPALPKRSV